MQTEAIFKNINQRIEKEIVQAKHTIYVVVAWFTDEVLFNALTQKAKEGCRVFVITSNDFINDNSRIDYQKHYSDNFKIHLYGNSETNLIHHKFCVIDNHTVITGSYNWTKKAKTNSENIVITKGNEQLAEKFIIEFDKLYKKITGEKNDLFSVDIDKIIKRIEVVKNLILLEDEETLTSAIQKLRGYTNSDLQNIINTIDNKSYSKTIDFIKNFITKYKNDNLTLWVDEELIALQFELKNLEIQLNAYSNEKIELEKILNDFQYQYNMQVGDIISEILKYRKEKYKNDEEKYKEAEKDEKEFNEQKIKDKDKKVFKLNKEEQVNIKNMFRKASMLCHPDKVNDEVKDEAEKMFIELKKAYDDNDIEKVAEILNSLENGHFFKSKSDTITENEKLKIALQKIKFKINAVLSEITRIKENKTFKTVSSIEDWDSYFEQLKNDLTEELENLKKDIL